MGSSMHNANAGSEVAFEPHSGMMVNSSGHPEEISYTKGDGWSSSPFTARMSGFYRYGCNGLLCRRRSGAGQEDGNCRRCSWPKIGGGRADHCFSPTLQGARHQTQDHIPMAWVTSSLKG